MCPTMEAIKQVCKMLEGIEDRSKSAGMEVATMLEINKARKQACNQKNINQEPTKLARKLKEWM